MDKDTNIWIKKDGKDIQLTKSGGRTDLCKNSKHFKYSDPILSYYSNYVLVLGSCEGEDFEIFIKDIITEKSYNVDSINGFYNLNNLSNNFKLTTKINEVISIIKNKINDKEKINQIKSIFYTGLTPDIIDMLFGSGVSVEQQYNIYKTRGISGYLSDVKRIEDNKYSAVLYIFVHGYELFKDYKINNKYYGITFNYLGEGEIKNAIVNYGISCFFED